MRTLWLSRLLGKHRSYNPPKNSNRLSTSRSKFLSIIHLKVAIYIAPPYAPLPQCQQSASSFPLDFLGLGESVLEIRILICFLNLSSDDCGTAGAA